LVAGEAPLAVPAPPNSGVDSVKSEAASRTRGDHVFSQEMDLGDDFDPDDEEQRAAVVEDVLDQLKASALSGGGQPLVEKDLPDTPEQEAHLQAEARALLAADGVDTTGKAVKIIELEEAPRVRYETDKKLMLKNYDRGDIHLVETSCASLLARVPEDTDVWRTLTMSRLRLRFWDAALEAARRWISFDPCALGPRNAEALALVGCGEFGEARARFEQLAKEVEAEDAGMAQELREALWRIDELWSVAETRSCTLSARPATLISGTRPPHFYLPNFADSIGPVKVLYARHEEYGGGQSHQRKLVVTREVAAGDVLFVQNPLVFGLVEEDRHLERLSDALLTAATTSPRAATLIDLLADDGPLEERNRVVTTISDTRIVQEKGTWSKSPADMGRHLEACKKIVERSTMVTGHAYAGVWTLPAMARHSCCPSASFTCFGDAHITRAARDLKPGDEVTFSFWDIMNPLEERRQTATETRGGFWCRCPRCEAEDSFCQQAGLASEKMRRTFIKNASRTQAIKDQITVKVDAREKEIKRRFAFKPGGEEERQFRHGLHGLADRFRNLNGRTITDSELDEVWEFLPPVYEPDMVEVPQDLADELLGAVMAFDEDLASCNLNEEHQRWFVASHLNYYNEVLLLAGLLKDLSILKYLVRQMLPAVASVAPGSFVHQRLALFNWEVAAQSEDPSLSAEAPSALAPREMEMARDCLRLRYGRDLSPVEMDAALGRTAVSRDADENWFWEVSWCIGSIPRGPDPDRGVKGSSNGLPVI